MNIDNALWDFAIKFYAEPLMAQQLLSLQDEENLNVNVLIFAIWLATQKRYLIASPEAENVINHWHMQVIEPIREARAQVKRQRAASSKFNRALEGSYQQLLKTELAMEQVELMLLFDAQQRLSESRPKTAPDDALIKKNLLYYFKSVYLGPINKSNQQAYFVKCEQLISCAENILGNADY